MLIFLNHICNIFFDITEGLQILGGMQKNAVYSIYSTFFQFKNYFSTNKFLLIFSDSRAHLLNKSFIPISTGFAAYFLVNSLVNFMYLSEFSQLFLVLSLIFLCFCIFWWCNSVVKEALEGNHSFLIQQALYSGFFLFILSEALFFFGIFWSFFHSILTPTIEIGSIWPIEGVHIPATSDIPFLNTALLISSGLSVTWVHKAIFVTNKDNINLGFFWTILFAFCFLYGQIIEYLFADFSFNDGVYGSVFYLATGFHGFHVLIGTVFLLVCWLRAKNDHFVDEHHIGFECAVWYWHFVDIVWIFLFFSIYFWGNL